jgi:hypothetical protein
LLRVISWIVPPWLGKAKRSTKAHEPTRRGMADEKCQMRNGK